MGKLNVFNFMTLNGFFKGANDDISWNQHTGEENEYAEEGLDSKSTLVFGRITYQMMAGWWPTPMAAESAPKVAQGMNAADKVVFSRTLEKADWQNTRLIKDDLGGAIRTLKSESNVTVLGSGSLVSQLTELGLVDTYQFMVNPVAIADGTPVFSGIKDTVKLRLTSTREFSNGIVLLCYEPA